VSVWASWAESSTHFQLKSLMPLSWSIIVRNVCSLLFRAEEFTTHNIVLAKMIQLVAIRAPQIWFKSTSCMPF
jgi:hypothetical protein